MDRGRAALGAQKVEQETKNKKFQEDRDNALKNLKDLTLDEVTKARTYKRCPYCSRMVEKLADTCDVMV